MRSKRMKIALGMSAGLVSLVASFAQTARAQEGGHGTHDMGAGAAAPPAASSASAPMTMPMPSQADATKMDMPKETAPLGLSMSREGSGTAWQPDSTPMSALHFTLGEWRFMFHENVFVGVDATSGARGDTKVTSVNWLMLMARHSLGPGEFGARVMLSLEPLTVGGAGYPLLLQTGETWHGTSLHDHQHPHDLFMEIAAEYAVPLSDDVAVNVYVAPAGEPALGPVAFPHRSSAMNDPLAPIGHHWQDSTHIAYGVVTAGVYARKVKLEGSWFNGREPDENRYDLDLRVPDSYSGRLWFNPTENISMQTSYGYLRSPEAAQPDASLHRATASVTFNVPVFAAGNSATTALVGVNIPSQGVVTNSSLLESNLDITEHHSVFGRAELATKTGDDFVLTAERARNRYTVGALSLGYVFHFPAVVGFVPGLGARGSVQVVDDDLGGFYGGRTPVGGMVYLQIKPAGMNMSAGGAHGAGHMPM